MNNGEDVNDLYKPPDVPDSAEMWHRLCTSAHRKASYAGKSDVKF